MVKDSFMTLFDKEGQGISKLANSVSAEEIKTLIDKIVTCKGNILLTGCGTSAMDARKATHTLNVVGIRAFYLNPSDAVHGSLGVISSRDIVIFISKGGSTKELTNFVGNVQEKKAYIIVITENTTSILGKEANLVVKVKVDHEIDEFDMLATTSSLAVISLFDVVACTLMKKEGFNRKAFLLNHPSGDVGNRLRKEVN
jgi:D-arabinose 5-phosphate isomerase GutQ